MPTIDLTERDIIHTKLSNRPSTSVFLLFIYLTPKMFGGSLDPPKYVRRSRPKQPTYDIQLPTLKSGIYGHLGRQPNTDHHVRMLHYKQRLRDADTHFLASEAKRLIHEATDAKYDKHFAKKDLQRETETRFEEKVKAYDKTIEERREKLRKIICEEEQEFIYETIDQAQKGVISKMEALKVRAEEFKAQREAERMELVNKKRLQQATNDCIELRCVVNKRNLIDAKNSHMQQMRENESRKEAERELDNMWHQLMLKEIEAKKETEAHYEALRRRTSRELLDTWAMQLQGLEILKQEKDKVAAEDRMEMEKLQAQIRKEEIEALDAKRGKRNKRAEELLDQIASHRRFMEQRELEESSLDKAFARLAEKEVEKEKSKQSSSTKQLVREAAIYRQFLKELQMEQKAEDERLRQLLIEHRLMIEKKQDEAKCKIFMAREALQKSVLEGRAEQLEYKRQEAENQHKLKQAENELLGMMYDTNQRLQAEHDRLQAEAIRLYREDLQKQIECNQQKKRDEMEYIKKELADGIAEEEKRLKQVEGLIKNRLEATGFNHPLRNIMATKPCHCPREQ